VTIWIKNRPVFEWSSFRHNLCPEIVEWWEPLYFLSSFPMVPFEWLSFLAIKNPGQKLNFARLDCFIYKKIIFFITKCYIQSTSEIRTVRFYQIQFYASPGHSNIGPFKNRTKMSVFRIFYWLYRHSPCLHGPSYKTRTYQGYRKNRLPCLHLQRL
jgi:hypothetical protein